MEPPPLSSTAATTTTTTPQSYPDSLDSSPNSRHTDSWDDPPLSNSAIAAAITSAKLRLMCSYGGHIVPRPHDKSLCYIGGDTRIIVVDRNVSLASLTARLSHSLMNGKPFVLKYQLPSEDLDSLISVTTDEDLENMIEEYERTSSNIQKPCRLRLFLFQMKLEASQSINESSTIKSEEWFLNALNAAGVLNRGFSDSASVNCLLGLDDEIVGGVAAGGAGGNGGGGSGGGGGINEGVGVLQKKVQDVQSVPDSPMMETSSSFGSSSSSPSLANLPPIRVHAEEGSGGCVKVQDHKVAVGIEEQFAQMNVGGGGGDGPPKHQQQEEGFVVSSSPAAATVSMAGMVVPSDYVNRVLTEDERSDHGVPVGYQKAPQPPPQSQSQQQPPQPQTITIPASQQNLELLSPDSVSSDNSLTNAINRLKTVMYQDQVMQIQSGPNRVAGVNPVDPKIIVSDPSVAARVHIQQQVQDSGSGYALQPQFEQQQQQQPQQQYINAGTHYIHHHQAGAVPMSAYYHQVYPSQQQQQQQLQQLQQQLQQQHHHYQQQQHHQQLQQHQLDQQYPMYYVQQARQPQAYNMPVQQPNTISEAPTGIPSSQSQTPPSPAMVTQPTAYNPMRNTLIAKPEMAAAAGVYRTTTTGGPQLVQVPSNQHQQQYVGYSQIHHPSQSVAPNSAATPNYGYEFPDPAHAQIYYTQPLAPTMPSHYQTMTGVGMPEASGQLPTENMKQQMRTPQPQ